MRHFLVVFSLAFFSAISVGEVQRKSCSVCETPDSHAFSASFGVPCRSLSAVATRYDDGDENCNKVRASSFFECGCTYAPPPNASCPLCSNGSSLLDPYRILLGSDPMRSACGYFEWAASSVDDDLQCKAYQATLGRACNCSVAPEANCFVSCPKGTEFDLLRATIDFVSDDDGNGRKDKALCGELLRKLSSNSGVCNQLSDAVAQECCVAPGGPPEYCSLCPEEHKVKRGAYAGFKDSNGIESRKKCEEHGLNISMVITDSPECDFYEENNLYDECCELWEGCGLCPNGLEIQHPNKITNETTGATCASLDAELASVSDPGLCELKQLVKHKELSGVCGYCIVPSGARYEHCTLCQDGTQPLLPAETLFGKANVSCGELHMAALIDGKHDANICALHQIFSDECGCNYTLPEGVCSLCADGSSAPSPEIMPKEKLASGMSCGQLERFVAAVLTEDECIISQLIGVNECGCPYISPPVSSCNICSDGAPVPNPEKVLFDDNPIFSSCGYYEWFATSFTETNTCLAFQATAGRACDCHSAPELFCSPACPEGSKLDLLKMVSFGDENPDKYDGPCMGLVFELSSDADFCSKNSVAVAESCCVKEDVAEAAPTTAPSALSSMPPARQATVQPVQPSTSSAPILTYCPFTLLSLLAAFSGATFNRNICIY